MLRLYALVLNMDLSIDVVIVCLRNEIGYLFKYIRQLNKFTHMCMRVCEHSELLYAYMELVPVPKLVMYVLNALKNINSIEGREYLLRVLFYVTYI